MRGRITRTCGGDPRQLNQKKSRQKVLPAHAGVIPFEVGESVLWSSITRTCGGDPGGHGDGKVPNPVLPAHAGVILHK